METSTTIIIAVIIALYAYNVAFRSPTFAEEKNVGFGERFMHRSRELLYFTVQSQVRFCMIQTWEEYSLFVNSACTQPCALHKAGNLFKEEKKRKGIRSAKNTRGVRHQIHVVDE